MMITSKITRRTLLFIITIAFLSCKSYTIPIDSFKEQLMESNSSSMKGVRVNNPLSLGTISYAANNVEGLIVKDKNGSNSYLRNSPSIEMRVTHVNGKKYHMYFDTVIIENNILKGARSRLIQGINREIPIDSIVKIEVQDGGKKFRYQQ